MTITIKNSISKQRRVSVNLLVVSLTVVLIFASLFVCLLTTNAATTIHVDNENDLRSAIERAVGPTIIVLDDDIYLTGTTLDIDTGKDIMLKSNSDTTFFSLFGPPSVTAITVNDGGKLELAGIILTFDRGAPSTGVYVYPEGTLILSDGEISGCVADEGGGVYSTGDFTMSGGVISNNMAFNGGGVYIYTGTFSLSGGMICDNTAEYRGGGVYTSYTFEMSGTASISGNTAEYGGGVYTQYDFSMSGGEISNNVATANGGGVYTHYVIFDMYDNSVISNNIAYDGGGVYNYRGEFNLFGGEISNNIATDSGGGVCNTRATTSMSGGRISGNTASSGGGVFNGGENQPVSFNLYDGIISDNVAAYDGGGVSNTLLANFAMEGGMISGNKASVGGGIFSGYPENLTISDSAVFLKNFAYGGRYSGPDDKWSAYPNIKWDGQNSLGGIYNTQTDPHLLNNYDISTTDGTLTYTVQYRGNGNTGGDAPLDDNQYVANAPVTVRSSGTLVKTDYSFAGWATEPDGTGTAYSPGNTFNIGTASVILYAQWTLGQVSADPDWTRLRQAINDYSAGTVTIYSKSSGETENLTAGKLVLMDGEDFINSDGTAITIQRQVTLIAAPGVTITLNTPTGTNRHFLVDSTTGDLTLDCGVILDGKKTAQSATNGGGIDVTNGGKLTLNTGATIQNCRAVTGGGVCVMSGGEFIMVDGEISGNTGIRSSTGIGGGVYVGGGCSFEMQGGMIANNNAVGSGGGGVCLYYDGASFTMTGDARICNNTANSAGGVYVGGGGCSFEMQGGMIAYNNASSQGGGVSVASGGSFSMSGDALLFKNAVTAASNAMGGGVYADGTPTARAYITMADDAVIANNTAGAFGGGVYMMRMTSFSMADRACVANNTAGSGAGGVAVMFAPVTPTYIVE
jgi:hypothetical protein